MITRFGLVSAALAALAPAAVSASASSKMDSRTFGKILDATAASDDSVVVAHFKKLYSYDSKDLTDHVTIQTADAKNVIVTDVEIDAEKLGDDSSMVETEGMSDWEKKDVAKRIGDKTLVEKIGLDTAALPMFKVYKKGKEVASLPVKEDGTTVADVQTFLTPHGIKFSNGKELEEFTELVEKFYKELTGSATKSELDSMAKEAEGIAKEKFDLDDDLVAKNMMAKQYTKVMKSAAKKGLPYFEAELTRVSDLLKSNAVTASKKKEMEAKVNVLMVFTSMKTEL